MSKENVVVKDPALDDTKSTAEGTATSTTKSSSSELVQAQENIKAVQFTKEKFVMKNHLDELTNDALVKLVEGRKTHTKYLALENLVFERFLAKNDPLLLEGMEQYLSAAHAPEDTTLLASGRRFPASDKLNNLPSATPSETNARINLTQKTDMVLHEIEDLQGEINNLSKKFHVTKSEIGAQIEELENREKEIQQTMNSFTENVVIGALDKLSQKIVPDKYIHFLEDWLRSARFNADKLRLRYSSLQVQYQKLNSMITLKKLVGENVQAVDFDQLVIENKNLAENFEKKTKLLLEMKKIYGISNLSLSNISQQLLKKVIDLDKLKKTIQAKKNSISDLDKECAKSSIELGQVQAEHEALKVKARSYKVPDVLEYLKVKEKVDELDAEIKKWMKKKRMKETSLAICLQRMKKHPNAGMTLVRDGSDNSFEFLALRN